MSGDKLWLRVRLVDSRRNEREPSTPTTKSALQWLRTSKVLEWVRAQIVTLRADNHGRAIANITRELIGTESGLCSASVDTGDLHNATISVMSTASRPQWARLRTGQ